MTLRTILNYVNLIIHLVLIFISIIFNMVYYY